MESYRNEPERRLEDLLRVAASTSSAEDDIRLRVVNLIESLVDDRKAELEVGTETGAIDILFGNVLIETKKDDARLHVAPDWARRDQHSRRAYAASQLQDYVNDRYGGVRSDSSVFDGYTTNGLHWCRWEVTVGAEVPELVWDKRLDQATLENVERQGVDRRSVIDSLFNDLVHTLQSRPGPPDDLQQLLADLPEAAYELATELGGQPDFEIKRSVWSDLMRAGFILKEREDEDDLLRLFATHSLLVDLGRRIVDNLMGVAPFQRTKDDSAFYSWISTPQSVRGERSGTNPRNELTGRIDREVNRYNWKLASSDVLKGVYHAFIPRGDRHDFGEYYTPDWLAEAICEEVLDAEWCETAVRRASDPDDDLRGCGVLEPSCGSGTFLRATARRLLPFAQRVTADATEQANIICRLIHGLDIHPVAVELARATVLASLPAPPSHGYAAINVHISDSLRWMQDTQMRLLGDGILIQVPPVGDLSQVDVLVPDEVVMHPEFGRIIDAVLDLGEHPDVLTGRLQAWGVSEFAIASSVEASETLGTLRSEDRNHVWGWYIKNVSEAYRLHDRRFDRMVGNPPWITRKDITQGDKDRAERHRRESMRLNVWAGGITHATQNNLAALFTASVARDYTHPSAEWKVAFVLPWSALRTDTWANFRKGRWAESSQGASDEWTIDLSKPPWDMRLVDQRPFPQSDSCVIFGSASKGGTSSNPLSPVHEVWSGIGAEQQSRWSDLRRTLVRELKEPALASESEYLERTENGATLFPICLVRIDPPTIRPAGRGFKSFELLRSRHGPWKSVDLGRLTIEDPCVRRVAYATDLAPFRVLRESYACLPPDGAFLEDDPVRIITQHERFTAHWYKSDDLWGSIHGSTPPATLFERVNFRQEITMQLKSPMPFRVAYPGSGSRLFGVVFRAGEIVNHGCYYVDVATEQEADFLTALLASEGLQAAYRESQVTDRHYDKHPLRTVPIPEFDASTPVHHELANFGSRATKVSIAVPLAGGTQKMRDAIRDALREDGVMDEIDRCARELLPDFAEPAR